MKNLGLNCIKKCSEKVQKDPDFIHKSIETWIENTKYLTLIPPSGDLYGSQFLVGKLFEVHKGYENETIIYSSIFYADS